MTSLTVCQSSLTSFVTRLMFAAACSSRTAKASIIDMIRL
jgi:hypothetical protein